MVEIENVMDGEAQGDRNGDPDVRVEVETCGNYEKRVRPVVHRLTHTTNNRTVTKHLYVNINVWYK